MTSVQLTSFIDTKANQQALDTLNMNMTVTQVASHSESPTHTSSPHNDSMHESPSYSPSPTPPPPPPPAFNQEFRDAFFKEFGHAHNDHSLNFHSLTFRVFDKKTRAPKEILSDVNGTVKAGQVLAVLGPSGSGKTTLLNMLTLSSSEDGTAEGEIQLSGSKLTRSLFTQHCYYVPQYGALHAFLTPRETLTYAAQLAHAGDSQDKILSKVHTLLMCTGLLDCADTKVGNEFFAGLSGGQKKRLAIAVALINSPIILFLDEPTSGLDSAAAAGIMSLLKELAVTANVIIICTIHQPSSSVFYEFNQVMLLAQGHTAYLGPADQAVSYFASVGLNMPVNSNPAEYMLDLVNSDFTDKERVSFLIDSWANKQKQTQLALTHSSTKANSTSSSSSSSSSSLLSSKGNIRSTSFLTQLNVLVRRHAVLMSRDPTVYLGRLIMFFAMSMFFAIIYYKMRDRVQEEVLNRMWVILWYVGPPCSLAVIAVYAYNMEFASVRNEMKNGMVDPLAYVVANTLLQVPVLIVITFIAFIIPMGAVSNLQPGNLPLMLLLLACTLLSFETHAQMLAVVYDQNFLMGMLSLLNFWFAAFVFSGIMVRLDDVPWPFKILMYILPLRYSLSSLVYTEFHGSSFSGTVSVPVSDTSRGFICPGLPSQQCYGEAGDDVLASLHANWDAINADNNVGRDFGILLAIAIVFKLIFALNVVRKGTYSKEPTMVSSTTSASASASSSTKVTVSAKQKQGEADEVETVKLRIDDGEPNKNTVSLSRDAAFLRAFANTNLNAEFEFRDIWFQVSQKKKKQADDKINNNSNVKPTKAQRQDANVKHILKGVSGKVHAGQMLVIMGPSGAGKTSLLNTLTLEQTGGKSFGSMTLNGMEMNQSMFVKNCYYVPQYPTHYAFLTARETLLFASRLGRGRGATRALRDEIGADGDETTMLNRRVDMLLQSFGLSECADTIVGNELVVGLSNGQRKRLAIAVALLTKPLVLFLDEPTTGLDSAAAASIMSLLKQLAVSANLIIVCTIHQPSAQVFAGFDKVMLLARGQTAFLGNTNQIVPYFASIGLPMPETTSAAEYMLDCVNDEFTSKEKVKQVVQAWSQRAHTVTTEEVSLSSKSSSSSSSSAASSSWLSNISEMFVLLHRHGLMVMRDPTLYWGRTAVYLISNIFFCIIYVESRNRKQELAVSRIFDLMWCVGSSSSMALITVFAQNKEMFAIKNEVKNGLVGPVSYFVSNMLLQLPLLFIMVIVGFLLPLYAIENSTASHLGEMVVILAVTLWSFESVAQAMAVQDDNFLMGMLNFLNFWFSSFLFAGVVIKTDDVPWPFRIFVYISPLRYGLETMVYLDTKDATYSGAVSNATSSSFYCPGDNSGGVGCFGETGSQVLNSLHANFDSIQDTDNTGRNIGICIAIALGFKLVFFSLLYLKSTAASSKLEKKATSKNVTAMVPSFDDKKQSNGNDAVSNDALTMIPSSFMTSTVNSASAFVTASNTISTAAPPAASADTVTFHFQA